MMIDEISDLADGIRIVGSEVIPIMMDLILICLCVFFASFSIGALIYTIGYVIKNFIDKMVKRQYKFNKRS